MLERVRSAKVVTGSGTAAAGPTLVLSDGERVLARFTPGPGPAPLAEMAFNLAFLAWAIAAWRLGWQRGQRFNVYLMAYGAFRFAHEFVRDDARWVGPFGGYHLVSLAILATGAWMYRARSVANARQPNP